MSDRYIFPVLKLIQYYYSPASCHANAVKNEYQGLNGTIDDGLFFRKSHPNTSMLSTHAPVLDNSTYTVFIFLDMVQANTVYGYTHSDWANDSSTRKSVSGTAIILADGSIVYKIIL